AMRIADLLDEVRGGHNASRTRYVVYEVRGLRREHRTPVRLRGVTNKFHALEDRIRRSPPDTLTNSDVVVVARCATSQECAPHLDSYESFGDGWWNRFPPIVGYLDTILHVAENGDLLWSIDNT